jgi:hypothetical protein
LWKFPLPPCGLPLFCCMLAKYFGSCLLFLFLSLAWVLSFYFFSSFLGVSGLYIYIFKCLNLWNIFFFVIVKSNDMKESSIMTCTLVTCTGP